MILDTLREFVNHAKLPHLMFYGRAGTGKTTTIKAFCRDIFGSRMPAQVLEINASDENGIDVIRNTVKAFTEGSSVLGATEVVSSVPAVPDEPEALDASAAVAASATAQAQTQAQEPPASGSASSSEPILTPAMLRSLKIVILDECDHMTAVAQGALRRLMEASSRNTRFCLICNYPSKIIPAVQSRCTKFRFRPLPQESCVQMMRSVCIAENLKAYDAVLKTITRHCEGDMRKCLNLLQSLALSVGDRLITEEDVYKVSSKPAPIVGERLLDQGGYSELYSVIKSDLESGIAPEDILGSIYQALLAKKLPLRRQISLLKGLALCEEGLARGASIESQMAGLCGVLSE